MVDDFLGFHDRGCLVSSVARSFYLDAMQLPIEDFQGKSVTELKDTRG